MTQSGFVAVAETKMPEPYQAPAVAEWSDEQLRTFARELTGYVYEHHVVTETDEETYGMTYEWYDPKTDRRIQGFGLDAMHDGGWFTAGMMTAERIDPEGDYLERALEYQVPFYVNMLNHADQLFPKQRIGADVFHEPPMKGWVPRGWDSGIGYDIKGEKFEGYTFSTPSNHLAQDLADMLLAVWLTTRSPRVAEAAVNLQQERAAAFPNAMKIIEHAVEIATGEASPPPVTKDWSPGLRRGSYPGMYLQRGAPMVTGGDGLAWRVRGVIADAALRGEVSPAEAWGLAYETYSSMVSYEIFYDDRPLAYGLTVGDDHGAGSSPKFMPGTGKLQGYHSQGKRLVDARGVTGIWPGAALLPALRKHPDVWERPYRQNHTSEGLVRIVDEAPKTDGKRDSIYDQSQSVGPDAARVTLIGDPRNLHVLIESSQPKLKLTLQHSAEVEGEKRTGVIEANAKGEMSATNDQGDELLHASAFRQTGDGWTAELRIPYTALPEQAHWINGVDHGRYDVQIDGSETQVVYMLSTPQRVIDRLQAYSLGAIEDWHNVWEERGIIPWVLTRQQWNDAGHAGHLVHLISYILMDRAGTPEWQLIREQKPSEPMQFSLPDSVLEEQGVK